MKVSIIIPAQNEEQNVGHVVRELQEVFGGAAIPYEIIVVNDNSTDGTPEVVTEMMASDPGVKLVNRRPPSGFGRAIRAGFEVVSGDVVIIYMSDRSDDPKDALAYYRKIGEGYDCVFGSRFRKGSKIEHYPKVKLIFNRIVNWAIRVMFMCPFNDLTNAFKAYRTEVVHECGPYSASHFNITIEMSLSALVHRYNIAEIPISWYGRSWGSSKLKLTQMGRRYLSVLLKLFFERMLISDDIMAERLAHQTRDCDHMSNVLQRLDQLERRVNEMDGQQDHGLLKEQ